MRRVFLDISKAFDKVWHKVIIFKLKQNGISGKLLSVLLDFLKDRKQSYFKWTSFFMDRCKRRTPSGINVGSKPVYLFNLIPTKNSNYNTRNTDKLLYFVLNITFSNFFFHLLLLNGTSWILIFEVPLVLLFSKRIR